MAIIETILGPIDEAEMQRVESRGRFTLQDGTIINIRKTEFFYQNKLVYASRTVRGINNVVLQRDNDLHDHIAHGFDIVVSEDT